MLDQPFVQSVNSRLYGQRGAIPPRSVALFRGLVCILFCIFILRLEAAEGFGADSLRGDLETKLQTMECPGALVGVFPARGEAVRCAVGVADVKTRAPMELGFHMRIASISKLFLGTVILQLVDEGKLSLDDPISKYVSGVPAGDRITLRMLGNNTSGLFNTIENKEFQAAVMQKPDRIWTPQEILEFTFVKPVYAAPGEKWHYSNTNAVLLGMVTEKVTGRSLAEEIDRRICKRLGLKHTGFPVEGKLPKSFPSAYRNGYENKAIGYGKTFYDVSQYTADWTNAAGNMYSTLDDLGRAGNSLASGEMLGDVGKKELYRWVNTGQDDIVYGFCVGKMQGIIGHMGDVPGFNAFLGYLPEPRVVVVVLTNLSNNTDGTMPAEEIAKLVIRRFAADKPASGSNR